MPSEHIVKSYDEELKRLSSLLSQMGGMVEAQVADAIFAIGRRDSDVAARCLEGDARLDQAEHEVNQFVVRLLALRQPMANDLRLIVSALRIAADLERAGDYAANVAKRSIALNQMPPVRATATIVRMGRMVQAMLKDVLDALAAGDVDKAVAVWHRDEEIDEIYTSLFRELLTYMMEDPRHITPSAHLLFIAKNLERIGDHATNISESLYFIQTGTQLTQARPKGDDTSFAVDPPAAAEGGPA
ncbi:MAG: phosphate signaling complex protein PhoU [Thalassobaculales bacterium]